MIGRCDCCDRQNVPVSHIDTVFGIKAFACYLCLGEDGPDPYAELHPCTCTSPVCESQGGCLCQMLISPGRGR
jgi:hypothetical protein